MTTHRLKIKLNQIGATFFKETVCLETGNVKATQVSSVKTNSELKNKISESEFDCFSLSASCSERAYNSKINTLASLGFDVVTDTKSKVFDGFFDFNGFASK